MSNDITQRVHFAHLSMDPTPMQQAAADHAEASDRLVRALRGRSISPAAPMAARRHPVDAETLDERDDTPTVPTKVQR